MYTAQVVITDGTELNPLQKNLLKKEYTTFPITQTDIRSIELISDEIIKAGKFAEYLSNVLEVIITYPIPALISYLSYAEGIKTGKGNISTGLSVILMEKTDNGYILV